MWDKKDLLNISDFDRKDLLEIFELARKLEGRNFDILRGKILATAFFEPSTRTRLSFQTAMLRLGGTTISFEKRMSSMEKGESEEDTLLILDQYADIIVIRHKEDFSVIRFAEILKHPVINAGDGKREHPTQTILDLYTIWKEFGKIDGLKILVSGDLKYGRTVHSLMLALKNFSDVKTYGIYVGNLKMPEEFKVVEYQEFSYEDGVSDILNKIRPDVLYVTRVQKERIEQGEFVEYKITQSQIDILPENSIVMHPLPRTTELPIENFGKHQRMFEQAKNGVFIRMAILLMMFNKQNLI